MSSVYTTFRIQRVVVSLVASLVLVSVFAFVAKALVETLTSYTYTIHWFETVPFLVLGVGFVLNGWLNEQGAGDEEADT